MPDFIQTADWAVLHWIRENLHCGALDFLMPKLTLLGEGGAVWIVAGLALTASKKYRKHVRDEGDFVLLDENFEDITDKFTTQL